MVSQPPGSVKPMHRFSPEGGTLSSGGDMILKQNSYVYKKAVKALCLLLDPGTHILAAPEFRHTPLKEILRSC